MAKIPYNKPEERKKRSQIYGGQAEINSPALDIEEIKRLLAGEAPDLSKWGLPFDEVKAKINEAMQYARDEERERYEGTIRTLDSKLSAANKQLKALESSESEISRANEGEVRTKYENELRERDKRLERASAELLDLKEELERKKETIRALQASVNELKNELKSKNEKLERKDEIIENLSSNSSKDLNVNTDQLQDLVSSLLSKVENLNSMSSTENGLSNKPKLSNEIFVDVTDGGESFDPHINIAEDINTGVDRDKLENDINKLKNMLGKGRYKPVPGKD